MDFIIDNYVWFIVAGVILIMTLIGYIADKTEFVENQKAKDKEKKKKQEQLKKEKKSKEQEIFEKEIHNGKNLVLEESPVDYPIEIEESSDEPPVDTSFEDSIGSMDEGLTFEEPVPVELNEEAPSTQEPVLVEENEEAPSFESPIDFQTEPIEAPITNDTFSEVDPDIMKPLEGGVLNLDNYAKEEEIAPIEEPEKIIVPEEPMNVEMPSATEDIIKPEESTFTDDTDADVWKF